MEIDVLLALIGGVGILCVFFPVLKTLKIYNHIVTIDAISTIRDMLKTQKEHNKKILKKFRLYYTTFVYLRGKAKAIYIYIGSLLFAVLYYLLLFSAPIIWFLNAVAEASVKYSDIVGNSMIVMWIGGIIVTFIPIWLVMIQGWGMSQTNKAYCEHCRCKTKIIGYIQCRKCYRFFNGISEEEAKKIMNSPPPNKRRMYQKAYEVDYISAELSSTRSILEIIIGLIVLYFVLIAFGIIFFVPTVDYFADSLNCTKFSTIINEKFLSFFGLPEINFSDLIMSNLLYIGVIFAVIWVLLFIVLNITLWRDNRTIDKYIEITNREVKNTGYKGELWKSLDKQEK